jgi:hypothetical protein
LVIDDWRLKPKGRALHPSWSFCLEEDRKIMKDAGLFL